MELGIMTAIPCYGSFNWRTGANGSSLNCSWKIPIGYILINSFTAEEKANLVRESTVRLNEINVHVAYLTVDLWWCPHVYWTWGVHRRQQSKTILSTPLWSNKIDSCDTRCLSHAETATKHIWNTGHIWRQRSGNSGNLFIVCTNCKKKRVSDYD